MNRSVLPGKTCRVFLLASTLLFAVTTVVLAWGTAGHEIVSTTAITLLSGELRAFLQANTPNLILLSAEPDAMSLLVKETAAGHFVDLDALSRPPFQDVPSDEAEFAAKFGKDAFQGGRLPWAVRDEYEGLVAAFRTRNYEEILKRAAYLSHFVADATMPLHSTKNYKGQSSGNVIFDTTDPDRHVHVRFEIGMVEAHRYDLRTQVERRLGEVRRLTNPAEEVLALSKVSYEFIEPILNADKELLKPGRKVTEAYYRQMYEKVGKIAAQQLALAATCTASFWQSAWVEAGRPKLFSHEIILSRRPLTIRQAARINEMEMQEEKSE